MTKVEAAKLTNDLLLRGVIETIVKESSVLLMLPFMEVTGTALTYNREATMPQAQFYDVGDTWAEATPTFTQVTVPLRILGGDADIDNFLQQTYANPNDLEAVVLESRAKAVAYAFTESFFIGDSTANPKSFDGLRKLVPAAQTISPGANGGSLTLDLMDQLIDLVKPGKPDALLMSKRTRRKLSALRRASGNLLETDVDQFGRRALFYDGIPILVDDFIPDNETLGTGTNLSSIYAVKFGSAGVMGLENGGIQVVRVGDLETKDASRWRVKWYVSLAVFSELGVARLQGITAN
ncbi:phage major capsid protein [Thermomicrobiaceae bacterium CFH 74404]|uniref:Phage major capsid protein n=1 Tax=Thermalbibacter longus TaxID=2951981 RepID=A0AA42BB55_9BACT|nr:phage major capsid protein [Thermalbibacter longus]MCM8749459.1 phage major capsid protein [Thermalbibacter longus]